MKSSVRILVALSAMLAATSAFAENYPSKPVKIIIPFSAGGVTDITGLTIKWRRHRLSVARGRSATSRRRVRRDERRHHSHHRHHSTLGPHPSPGVLRSHP
mgnify:CR=1 FL=1